MIQIKNASVLRKLLSERYDLVLIDIVTEVLGMVPGLITDGYREGDKGVHGTSPVRGIDMRSRIYSREILNVVEKHINSKWQYDPKRPHKVCCMIHDVGKGVHIHLQVHPNTTKQF